jgi:hypothetical protein
MDYSFWIYTYYDSQPAELHGHTPEERLNFTKSIFTFALFDTPPANLSTHIDFQAWYSGFDMPISENISFTKASQQFIIFSFLNAYVQLM